ncbi:MAG: ABC transporter permease [Pirellulaceae bacterium]|nr:ABC transporter permease [Pirellulaceae bacterium]
MRAIDKKLLRDLWTLRGQALAVCLVIASGIAICVMSLSTLDSLTETRDTYYSRYNFAHLFATVRRAPLSVAQRISEIDSVAQVDPRIVQDVTLIVSGMDQPATARLISIPDLRQPALNQIYLRRGRMPEAGRGLEVLVGESFAEKHGFLPGDSVQAILNGRLRTLNIVGIALSPEYVLQVKPGQILPDSLRFGIFWLPSSVMEAAFDMKGAFNDVSISIMHGANETEVARRVDTLLDPWGNAGCFGRSEQMSARYLADEIRQLRGTGMIVPTVFLAVAAFLLNIVLSRLIQTQRDQIAALKAFGYFNLQVGWHYFKLIAIVVLAASILGTLVGSWMGRGLTQMYTTFYRFPLFYFQLDLRSTIVATLLSLGAASLGSLNAVLAAVRLPPAEAMRPESPARYSVSLIERFGLRRLTTRTMRMVLRQLQRRPWKSALSCIGISLGTAVMVVGGFMTDALDYLVDFQFRLSQRDDVTVVFRDSMPISVVTELQHLPGVMRTEPFRSLAVRLTHGPRWRRMGIMGLDGQQQLFRLLDSNEQRQEVPERGLLVSEKVAQVLGVQVGDMVDMSVLEGKRPRCQVMITGLIRDFGGMNAYMPISQINQLMTQPPVASGAWLKVDSRWQDELYRRLKATPGVTGVTVKQASIQSFIDTIAENQLKMQAFNIAFACVIACGVVYNTARISLSERGRELATLRVLGFTVAEVSAILLGELAVITSLAIPCGLLIGNLLTWLTTLAMQTEMYRIPFVVSWNTWFRAAFVVLLASVISSLIVQRHVKLLDMISVLKSPE